MIENFSQTDKVKVRCAFEFANRQYQSYAGHALFPKKLIDEICSVFDG